MTPTTRTTGVGGTQADDLLVLTGQADVHLDYEASDWPVPCATCLHWHSDVVLDETGLRVLREWHHPDCPTYRQWL